MPIQEKQRDLEFTFELSGSDAKYDLCYKEGATFSLMVTCGRDTMSFPVELFVEVVNFLRAKGVFKPVTRGRTVATPGTTIFQQGQESSLPVPQIEMKERKNDTEAEAPVVLEPLDVDPIVSFDAIPSLDKKSVEVIATPVGPIISNETKTDIPERIVIRTRVTDGDPASAEREASELRNATGKGKGKTIKRARV